MCCCAKISRIDGALDVSERHGVDREQINIIRTPGAFEIPKVAQIVVQLKKCDGIICLGALIKGDTYHFDVLANEVTKGLAQINLTSAVPISFGVLTTNSIEQSIERSGSKAGNKGAEAALSYLEMVNLFNMLRQY